MAKKDVVHHHQQQQMTEANHAKPTFTVSSPGSAWTVSTFLLSIGVDESNADSAATALLDVDHKTEKHLLSEQSIHPEKANVASPVDNVVHAHQKEGRQKTKVPTRELIAGCNCVMHAFINDVWTSVLCVHGAVSGNLAAVLVFDVFSNNEGQCLLFVLNEHVKINKDELHKLLHCGTNGTFYEVETFEKQHESIHAKCKECDFVVHKLPLEIGKWMVHPGVAERGEEHCTNNQSMGQQKWERPKAQVICKSPCHSFDGKSMQSCVQIWISGSKHWAMGMLDSFLA